MEHRRAIELLPSLTAGSLHSEERADLYCHVAECAECAAWIETRGLVTSALSDRAWSGHPAGDLLARSAVGDASLSRAECQSLDAHLAVCEPCREARDLAAGALRAARGEAAAAGDRSIVAGGAGRLAIAAALILGLALVFLLRSVVPPRDAGLPPGDPAASAIEPVASPVEPVASPVERVAPQPERVASRGIADITIAAGDSLAGTRLIDAGWSISATAVEIETGSDVTFRAGEAVILGEGFAVGSDASFAIEIAAVIAPRAPAEGT